MPSILDYMHAKCSLFRTPPLDFTGVESKLKEILVENWQNNYSASGTVEEILNNPDVAGKLTAQVAESLAYQRKANLAILNAEKKVVTKQIKEEQVQAIQNVDEQCQYEIEQAQREAEELREAHMAKRIQHTATEQSVVEMRDRVQKSLGTVGGERNLAALFEINQQLLGEEKSESVDKPKRLFYEKVHKVEHALKSSLPVAEGKTKPDENYRSYIQKKREGTILGKILRLFDYEIW